MDGLTQMLLIVGLIFISSFSLKVNQDAINSMNAMNEKVQMMFVKS
jgi:hypothetical protein